jgi:hypothetical protein
MKKILLLFCLALFCCIDVNAQAYDLSMSDMMDLFNGSQPEIDKIAIAHGFQKKSGNLWLYKKQENQPDSIFFAQKENLVNRLFFMKCDFLVAVPTEDKIKAMFIAFDTKYLGYYLNMFGKAGFSGLYADANLNVSGNPIDEYCTSEFTLKTSEKKGTELRIKIWHDRCMLTLMYLSL